MGGNGIKRLMHNNCLLLIIILGIISIILIILYSYTNNSCDRLIKVRSSLVIDLSVMTIYLFICL